MGFEKIPELEPDVETQKPATLDGLIKWLVAQQKKAKVAWTIVLGLAAYLGYDLSCDWKKVEPKEEEVPGIVLPVDDTPGTVIKITGDILEIDGYRVRKMEESNDGN